MACNVSGKSQPIKYRDLSSTVELNQQSFFKKELGSLLKSKNHCFLSRNRLTQWKLSAKQVERIANAMTLGWVFGSNTVPNDGTVHAGLTYLGQMITHDIVPDSNQSTNPRIATPFLNLDSLYPATSSIPFEQCSIEPTIVNGDGFFEIEEFENECRKTYFDFPRKNLGHCFPAITLEKRNDENVIISQLVVLWMRFHNAVLLELKSDPSNTLPTIELFRLVKEFVILTFQQIVVFEYLRRLLDPKVFRYIFEDHNLIFLSGQSESDFTIPDEFSKGAFRFGHSMVRQTYSLSVGGPTRHLHTLFQAGKVLSEKNVLDFELFFPGVASRYSIEEINEFKNAASKIGLNLAGGMTDIGVMLSKSTYTPLSDHYFVSPMNVNLSRRILSAEKKRNIVLEDLKACRSVATGGDILEAVLNGDFRHPLAWVTKMDSLNKISDELNFTQLERFAGENWITEISEGRPRLSSLSMENSPFWLFVLREAEQFPRKRSTNIPFEDCLGPVASAVVGEVLFSSIKFSSTNIFTSEISGLGPLVELHRSFSAEPSMANIINYVKEKTMEKNNDM